MGVKVTFLDDREQAVESSRPAVRLPSSAVVKDGENSYVWRVRDEELERVAVRTAGERDGRVNIVAGINAGDVVVAEQVEGMAEGVPVKTAQDPRQAR
jgi:membrane fusion protein (multidrug efflux system)